MSAICSLLFYFLAPENIILIYTLNALVSFFFGSVSAFFGSDYGGAAGLKWTLTYYIYIIKNLQASLLRAKLGTQRLRYSPYVTLMYAKCITSFSDRKKRVP